LADIKDLIIVFFLGVLIGRALTGGARVQAHENVEEWEMWEDESGRLHAVVHRKVEPVE